MVENTPPEDPNKERQTDSQVPEEVKSSSSFEDVEEDGEEELSDSENFCKELELKEKELGCKHYKRGCTV